MLTDPSLKDCETLEAGKHQNGSFVFLAGGSPVGEKSQLSRDDLVESGDYPKPGVLFFLKASFCVRCDVSGILSGTTTCSYYKYIHV